jgi:phosphoglycerol transferase MdoB-like AlkP superfamily enzyme
MQTETQQADFELNMPTNLRRQRRLHRRWLWMALLLVVLSSFAAVLIPAFLIQPFRPQTQRALELSFTLKQWSPIITLVALVVFVVLLTRLWSKSRWWSKALLIVAFVPTIATAWFARQNHFEWMFNPLRNSGYANASETNFVADSDMVLAVKLANEAVAYPVRQMAYHHLVHDVVGGVPLVATY